MASDVWTWILKLCIFTHFLHLCPTQTQNMRNVAGNKSCGLSSQYERPFESYTAVCTIRPVCVTGNCSAAINGNDDTNFNITGNPSNCIHTTVDDLTPFWWVDLGHTFVISKITIFGRKDFLSRMVCVNVSVDGQLVKRFTDTSGWKNDRYDVTVRREGRVINIARDCSTDDGGKAINICEVQVWVCDEGWYGNCTQTCGHCARSSTCEKVNGSCTSCDTGFQPPYCLECADGRYGVNCTQTCGNCAKALVCDKNDGSCKSCIPGFQTPLCKECASRFYGDRCTQTCGRCASNFVCDNVNGSCVSCEAGFQPPFCKVCEDGRYGPNCRQTCGNCEGDVICDKVTGTCTSCKTGFKRPECKDCDDGHYNVSNNCHNTCGGGCNDTCNKTDGTCQCRPGWEPPLCQGCQMGLWGDSCSHPCGDGCQNRTCDVVDGTCTCMTGWAAPRCEAYTCAAETVHGNASTAGPVAGAIVGTISGCVIGFLLGMLFMRFRLRQRKDTHTSSVTFTGPTGTGCDSSAAEATTPTRPVSAVYENTAAVHITSNVYDSLKASPDDNVYTKHIKRREATQHQYMNL